MAFKTIDISVDYDPSYSIVDVKDISAIDIEVGAVIAGPTGAGARWGEIIGAIADQSDLQVILGLKADKSTVEDAISSLQQSVDLKYDASNPAGYISGINWGQIGGAIGNQIDLIAALDAKANSADLLNYIQKSGDTMTGLLTLSTAANMGLKFGPSGDGTIRITSNSGLRIANDLSTAEFRLLPSSNDIYFQNTVSAGNIFFTGLNAGDLSGNVIFKTTSAVRPNANLAAALGTSSVYWSNGYIQRLYLNNTAYLAGTTPGLVSLVGSLGISGAIAGIGNEGVHSGATSGLLRLSGGNQDNGAVIVMGGSTNASIPNQGILRIGGTNIMSWASTGLTPGSNLGFDFGSPSFYWNNAYARRINLNSSAYLDGATNGVITVNGQLSVTSTLSSLGVVTNLGLNRVNSKSSATIAPLVISRLSVSNRGTFDAISAYAGEGDIFYCLDRNPDYTITSNYAAGSYKNLFNGDMSSDIAVPVANLATTPWVLTITKNSGDIDFTDVTMLRLIGHRLGANGATLTDWKVETRGTDGNWYTELNRTGVSDPIEQIAVPLHVSSQSYPDGFPTYHKYSGIRITVSGATEASFSPGNLSFAAVMLTNTRPAMTAARGLGALDMRGGQMYGYTEWRSGKVAFTPSEAGAASIRIPAGVAPTSPTDGDIWYDGASLKVRIAGVTRTVNIT